MEMGLKDKVALVTGSSKGLGLAVARGLAAEGCRLAVCARNTEMIKARAQEMSQEFDVEVVAQTIDLTKPVQAGGFVERAADYFGQLDILVTNAGGPPTGKFNQFSQEDWQRAVELNLFSAQALVRASLPLMRRQGGGRIVNLVSMSVKQPLPGLILSNSIRAAVIGWAKTLADEVGGDHIAVNNIMTGWIRTERIDEVLQDRADNLGLTKAEVLAEVEKAIPLGRIGRPDELADLAVFLASERASYITGASYLIDGGIYRGLM